MTQGQKPTCLHHFFEGVPKSKWLRLLEPNLV